MPVTITIHGENAEQALHELMIFANGGAKSAYRPNTGDRPETVPVSNKFTPATGGLDLVGSQKQAVDEMLAEAAQEPEPAEELPEESDGYPGVEPVTDSAGVPFDPDLHTGTLKKDGTWRVKKGKADEAAALVEEVAEEPEEVEEDEVDEFAAFKEAAAESEDTGPVEVPERTWTDADIGQLCNDAAQKLNNPAPVKALIAKYVPEGEVAHSRNVPNDQREAFAQEVEAAAGIEYAG